MQVLHIPRYDDWGHALDRAEKPKLAKALENTVDNLKPSEPKHEVVIVEQPEDRI